MENRWSDRRVLQLGVEVYRAGDKLLTCRSKDIGLGGAFLSVAETDPIQKDADVELVFHLLNDGVKETKYVLHAKVVRVVAGGIGLKFHDFDTSVFRSLQELINYKGQELVH
jgi:hypothetical protein